MNKTFFSAELWDSDEYRCYIYQRCKFNVNVENITFLLSRYVIYGAVLKNAIIAIFYVRV